MEEEMVNVVMGVGSSDMKASANFDEDQITFQMEVDEAGDKTSRNENELKTSDQGEGSNVVFAREGPLYGAEEPGVGRLGCYGGDRHKSKIVTSVSKLGKREETGSEKKLSRQDRIELARLFQGSVSSHEWETADSLISLADPNTLNDFLCIALDSIWFLCTQQDLLGITGLIKRAVNSGAYDFTRAALRTSFLASCVSACRSRTMSLPDAVTVMVQRLQERLQECNGDYVLKAEAGIKVQKFTEWALKCIGFHSRCHGDKDRDDHAAVMEIQLQLSAFKAFLDLAGNNLTGRDFTEAFDAACFPLTLFSSSFDPGWSAGTSASVVQGLLGLLVEGGADNVNQCFLEASRFGSTELVRILLQIAHRNSLDVDVDLALGFASHYGKINTMECLVEEGHAMAFLGPLMRAAERGCLPVVQWFVQRGCQDMELCLALTAATSSSHVDVAAYLLPHVPRHVLAALSIEILKVAGERSGRSLEGVAFLLRSDFLGDPAATYAVAESIAGSALGVGEETIDEHGGRIGALSSPSGGGVLPNLKSYLKENWSEWAYMEGLRKGREHFVNMARIVHRGESPLRVGDLPVALRVAISYFPLYMECTRMLNGSGEEGEGGGDGCLLSQRLRGELVEAVRRLGGVVLDGPGQSKELLAVLEHHLRPFLPGLTTE